MKKTLEKGQDKIQEICDILRHKTIEPAQSEANTILENAKYQASSIIIEAQKHAEQLIADARRSIEKEKNVFQSALIQASKQSIEALQQSIEYNLLNQEFHDIILKHMVDPKVIANLITAMIKAIEKDGLKVDLNALIPKTVSADEINKLLGKEILNKLKTQSVTLGDFSGGAKLRLEGKNMVLDISNIEIEELLRQYIRKDFRKLLFGNYEA